MRTRLYFTSESHVHSLITCLRYGGLLDVSIIDFDLYIEWCLSLAHHGNLIRDTKRVQLARSWTIISTLRKFLMGKFKCVLHTLRKCVLQTKIK